MNLGNCLCCHGKFTVIGKKNGYFLVKCQKCGFISTHPIPTLQEIKSVYVKQYFVKQKNSCNQFGYQNVFSRGYDESNRKISKIRLGIIYNILHRKGALLDVGCAAGTFLEVAKNQGWCTSGVEINKEMRNIAAKAFVNTISSSIEEISGFYEVITMWEYLEHTMKPPEVLQNVYQLLKPGGLLCLSFPNIESCTNIQSKIGWEHVKPPEHLHYWNAHNIKLFLKQYSFQIVGFRYFGLRMQLEGARKLGSRKNPKTILWPLMSISSRLMKHLYYTGFRKKFPSYIRRMYEGIEVYARLVG